MRKGQRILWLINHRTLMPYEAKLLLQLGFEVFTPKVIPNESSFRSELVDFTYDSSLTIPAQVLARLNHFNFYQDEWPSDIVAMVNRYFGTVFTIPYSVQFKEVVRKFKGQVLFRVFGLDNSQNYWNSLQILYGPEIYVDIYAIRERFWFAQAYAELAEVEPPLLAERALFLPIGLPDSFKVNENFHTGTDNRILFLCPNCVSTPYYAAVYKKFKEEFGDLPHVIIGVQDTPVDDPNVLGFISDEELLRLYRECAVLYYPSKELRHVHYSPIEAAINGMPVVYYAESLLGRMTAEIKLGRVQSQQEARSSIERILEGDREYITELRAEQRTLVHKFSDEYCTPIWKEGLFNSGYSKAIKKDASILLFIWRKLKKSLIKSIKNAISVFFPLQPLIIPPELLPKAENNNAIEDGIDFSEFTYPTSVLEIRGLSNINDASGRWSIGPLISIKFSRLLPKQFKLIIEGGGYGPNIGEPIKIKIGKLEQTFKFLQPPKLEKNEKIILHYSLRRKTNLIEIKVPKPICPPNDNREIGIALSYLKVEPIGK